MIQPCMMNRKEYKVVLLNKIAISVTSVGKGASFGYKELLFQWAQDAVKLLEQSCPDALLDGLIRVDIFCNAQGEWKVNEFEGFEAGFWSKAEPYNDLVVQKFLIAYWLNYILKYVYDMS